MPWYRDAVRDEGWLAETAYPGRGIIIGASAGGDFAVQVYWAMGRTAKSRNRIMVATGSHEVRTELATADPHVGDTSLILYRAMARVGSSDVVSNGEQTESLLTGLEHGQPFVALCQRMEVEPDSPNYTARIVGVLDWRQRHYQLGAIRTPTNDPEDQVVHTASYRALPPGQGHCITTYAGDGNPLPAFAGEPFRVTLGSDPEAIARRYWDLLDDKNRVALAVKAVSLATGEAIIHLVNTRGDSL